MSNLLKGTLILGGAALGIAAAHVAGPLVLVTSSIWGGSTYVVNALAAAGLSCSLASGYALGTVAGQTGTCPGPGFRRDQRSTGQQSSEGCSVRGRRTPAQAGVLLFVQKGVRGNPHQGMEDK